MNVLPLELSNPCSGGRQTGNSESRSFGSYGKLGDGGSYEAVKPAHSYSQSNSQNYLINRFVQAVAGDSVHDYK